MRKHRAKMDEGAGEAPGTYVDAVLRKRVLLVVEAELNSSSGKRVLRNVIYGFK
jgi:hypothetical protein